MISSHYRGPINYNTEVLEQNRNALDRLYTCRDNILFVKQNAKGNLTDAEKDWVAKYDARREQFIEAMDDDLNTADGITALFELVRDINTALQGNPSLELVDISFERFTELCDVLGLVYVNEEKFLDSEVEDLIAKRTEARKSKNFAEADRIRDLLKDMGIVLEDTPQGVKWHKA